ncbi:MAG: hypothetical protein IKN45_05795 [Lachnospiraceae bacterium]|nr:hypothetical protein [Lachnospiraceae bacterium]
MNKKIKRIGKTVLTFALVLTMLFGQLPSGLVLNSLAAPEETSEPSSENPGKGKDYSAGVSSIVDAPQDTSEVTSEEDSEEEDESESAPETVSDDSNLTSEVNADSETVIKEETNSDSAQDENNQDDNKQDDNKEDSSASEEAEVVSENPSEQISTEVPSEKEEISETPSENTSNENKPEIKDASGEKKSIISGIVEPFRNFGFIFFDIDSEGFEEMLGEPSEPIAIPSVTRKDDFFGVYDEFELKDYIDIDYAPETEDYIEVYYSIDNDNAGSNRTVTVTLKTKAGYVFKENESEITEKIFTFEGFEVKKKEISLNSIIVHGDNREYEINNDSIDNQSVEYNFGDGVDATKVNATGINYKFANANYGTNKAVVPVDDISSFNYDQNNYTITNEASLEEIINAATSDITISQKDITISFKTKTNPEKDSDGSYSLPVSFEPLFETNIQDPISVSLIDPGVVSNWEYSTIIPNDKITIDGVSTEQFKIEYTNESNETSVITENYDISLALYGIINLKKSSTEVIDLVGNDSANTDFILDKRNNYTPDDDITFKFITGNNKDLENNSKYWFNQDNTSVGDEYGILRAEEGVTFRSTNDLQTELTNIQLVTGNPEVEKEYVLVKNSIYYNLKIKYQYDSSAPVIDTTRIINQTGHYINDNAASDSLSGIYGQKTGLVKANKTATIDKTTFDNYSPANNVEKPGDDEYLWFFAEDKAGNKTIMLLSNFVVDEHDCPLISFTDVEGTVVGELDDKNYLSKLKFRVYVTDEVEEAKAYSGIKQVKLILLDGCNNPTEYKTISIYGESETPIGNGPKDCEKYIEINDVGYQLHFLVIAEDCNFNTRYLHVNWKPDAESAGGLMDGFLDETSESTTEEEAVKEQVAIGNTFAIAGENKVSVEFYGEDVEPNKYDEDDYYYYHIAKRTAKVKFNKIGIPNLSFDSGLGEGNKKDFSFTTYNPDNHCYDASEEGWTFSSDANDGKYEIGLPEKYTKLPFLTFENAVKNSKFIVDDSSPELSVKFLESKDASEEYKFIKDDNHESKYADRTIYAKITVQGKHLDTDLFKINYKNGELTEYAATWTESGNGYTTFVPYEKDGECYLHVQVKNKSQKDYPESPEYSFIKDTVNPKFNNIVYEGFTNKIDKTYYYGLLNGIEKESETDDTNHFPTMTVKAEIIEANVFKNDINVFVFTEKDGVDQEAEGVIKTFGENEGDANNVNNSYSIQVSVPSVNEKNERINEGKIKVYISTKDPAGHKMVSVTKIDESGDEVDVYTIVDGEYSSVENGRTDIIDTTRPVATYSINEITDANGKSYEGDADYYRKDFEVKFVIDDANYDSRYTTPKCKVQDSEIPVDKKKIFSNMQFLFNTNSEHLNLQDNRYVFSLEKNTTKLIPSDDEETEGVLPSGACDLAGNLMVFVKGSGTTSNDPEPQEKTGEYSSGTKVLDRKNPEMKLEIVPGANVPEDKKGTQTINGTTRYYFRDSFEAKFTIDELNYDSKLIYPKYGRESDNCKDYSTDEAPKANIDIEKTDDSKEFSTKLGDEKDGLYVLAISGCDKAGNPLVLSAEGAKLDTIEIIEELRSYVIVVDKTAPELDIAMRITGENGDFYNAKLSKLDGGDNYSVTNNHPYRQKPSGADEIESTITFTESDLCPTSLDYTIWSSDGKSNVYRYEEFKKDVKNRDNANCLIKEPQVYRIDKIILTDFAGNVVKMEKPSNLIYLDKTPPSNNDLNAPTTKFTASSPSRGNGNKIYGRQDGDTVAIKAHIEDNSGDTGTTVKLDGKDVRISSSGIYRVYFKVTVDGTPRDDFGLQFNGKGEYNKEGQFITYASGKEYSSDNPPKIADEELTYSDDITFTFPKSSFNNNDILIKVWTVDNAGNAVAEENAAYYRFGIDISDPKISVSYNNNSAQNGKYFKAPRTATIVVSERNFNANNTHISTQSGAHVSGWDYHKNDGNGDNDTWTAYVTYDTDGDYTLGVSAVDIVENGNNGVSWNDSVAPTEFTIDLTRPTINVSFDNNRVSNGRYYNANRRATIDINEHNFDTKDVTVERTASIAEGHVNVPGVGNWSRINDVNRTDVYFGQDGDYTMKVDYVDLAGNVAETYVVDTFTIDTVAPDLEIGGVEDKHAYNAKVAPSITYHDINYDKNSANISITGYNHPRGNNLDGVRSDERFGGSFICSNIDEVRDNDDIYTAKATISDLAGNTTEKEVTFSVNRFGSNYILSDSTKAYVDKYYNQDGEDLEITEINVNELSSYSVSYTKDGNLYNLAEDVEYSVEKSNPGWWQYDYHISDVKNFGDDSTNEGTYVVTLSSVDGASNKNSNRAVQETKTETNELPIEFIIDHTAPQVVFTGVEDNGKYRANERTIMIRYEDKSSFVDSLKIFNGDKLVEEYDAKQLSEKGGEIQFNAGASNNWQELKVEVTDAAGNMSPYESGRFLLTSNVLAQYLHSLPLVLATIGGVVLLIGVIIVILILRRRKRY